MYFCLSNTNYFNDFRFLMIINPRNEEWNQMTTLPNFRSLFRYHGSVLIFENKWLKIMQFISLFYTINIATIPNDI